ncbi:hypothetical protein F5X99DRAFT_367585 [Biscogniauxia marginata]|nr:hypothetical protein F5X99DRAFT_367585 [Biscogniauxia marginata]
MKSDHNHDGDGSGDVTEEDDVIDIDEDVPTDTETAEELQDHVKSGFEKDLEDSMRVGQDPMPADKDEMKKLQLKFVRDRIINWKKTTRTEGRNFLHFLAHLDYNHRPRPKWLMARAIASLPHLMGNMDNSKRTPLTIAISGGNKTFVVTTCNHVAHTIQLKIGKALESECEERDIEGNPGGVTCLHAAIMFPLEPELTKKIIDFVSQAMFVVTDSKGRTPLHLAVEYERCTRHQVGIVEALLAKGPAMLDVRMPDQYGGCSVYQHHEKTRREREKRENRGGTKPPPPGKDLSPEVKKENKLDIEGKRNEGTEAKKTGKLTREKSELIPGDQGGYPMKRHDSLDIARTPMERRTPTNLETLYTRLGDVNGLSGSPTLDQKANKFGQANIEPDEERRVASNIIREQLKLVYLRTKKPHEVLEFLHIQDQRDKELWFDFGPKPRAKTTMAEFQRHFDHLEFYKVLQYVAFPRLEFDRGDNEPDERYQGREDMLYFFDWLREKKGVERIIRVEVDDMDMPCHSDEAIEKALKPFSVEILDWRRLDLCPLTISRIGGSLREIHLQWSGSNSVLRSWSEQEGLALTPTLEKIEIKQIQGLNSEKWTKSNLDAFEKRLKDSWKKDVKPAFIRPVSGGGRLRRQAQLTDEHPRTQRQERNVDPHKWMRCMEEFASYFRQIKGISDRRSDPFLDPVKVALIDDGADIMHSELRGKKSLGKSFDYYNGGWRVSPFWDSASGHGTLMARLIHRICPSAVIYIVKLKTIQTANSRKIQIDPKSAIQAIEYAVEQNAQIISMSWTTKPPDNPRDREAFDNAIRKANSKGVLMFCSASDQGRFPDSNYPHASNPNYTFRIGAAKATGTTSDTVGDGHELNFIFPGHEVVLGPLYGDVADKSFTDFPSHTGSSVATALAAGLAALVLECVRLGIFYTMEARQQDPSVAIRREDLIKMRNKSAMEYAFSSIGVNRQTDNKYIEVWNTFSDVARDLKNNEGASSVQMGFIAGLARLFLRKGVKS